ncbi:MAG: hypothetical protein IT495_12895 [Gammaproteobacteria bacterium]|nr:hypothetical protein [Gammaproteobacteria bacterium]
MSDWSPIKRYFNDARTPRIALIGAGVSGICTGIELRELGVSSFVPLDKAADRDDYGLLGRSPGAQQAAA